MSKSARERTREMRKAQEEAARKAKTRKRVVAGLGSAVIVALIVAIVVVLVQTASDDDAPNATGSGSGETPGNLASSGAVPVGDPEAAVTVEIYFDYMCPACGAFEQANRDELDRLVAEGDAVLALRPISFLDQTSQGTRYSTRAANALATVVDGAPEAAWEFHAGMFENQPQEGTTGLSDDEIADIALDAGVPQAVVDRFEDMEFDSRVVSETEASREAGVSGTPTVKIDGEVFEGDLYSPGPLTEAVEAAAGSAE